MPYIGNEVGNRFVASKAASVYSGNGSTTAFTLEHAVGSDEDILVSVDGVIQEPSVAYAVSSGTTLTFTAAPSSNSGNNIFVYYLFRTVATVDHPSTSSLQATDGTFTAGITGTLQTAAQTNITSVGTLTSFRSTGIDDNADGLAITIDSSENVMVGKTSTNYQTVGVEAKTNGSLHATADQNNPIVAVRKTNDGKIQAFYKDTTEVGYIGNAGARLFINSGNVGLNFAGDGSNQILPSNAGANRDDAIILGTTNVRFKDLYLSGSVFLGGTGSSNALDDYEEGTWTPTVNSGTVSVTANSAYYIKIGRVVTAWCRLHTFSNDSDSAHFHVASLPFTISANNQEANIGTAWGNYMGNKRTIFFYSGSGNTTAAAAYHGSAGGGYGTVVHSTFVGGGNGTNMLIKLHYIST